MTKALKSSSEESRLPADTKVVRSAKTGHFVTVQGVGALKGSDLKIKKGVSLLKPIAKQALIERPEKRRAG